MPHVATSFLQRHGSLAGGWGVYDMHARLSGTIKNGMPRGPGSHLGSLGAKCPPGRVWTGRSCLKPEGDYVQRYGAGSASQADIDRAKREREEMDRAQEDWRERMQAGIDPTRRLDAQLDTLRANCEGAGMAWDSVRRVCTTPVEQRQGGGGRTREPANVKIGLTHAEAIAWAQQNGVPYSEQPLTDMARQAISAAGGSVSCWIEEAGDIAKSVLGADDMSVCSVNGGQPIPTSELNKNPLVPFMGFAAPKVTTEAFMRGESHTPMARSIRTDAQGNVIEVEDVPTMREYLALAYPEPGEIEAAGDAQRPHYAALDADRKIREVNADRAKNNVAPLTPGEEADIRQRIIASWGVDPALAPAPSSGGGGFDWSSIFGGGSDAPDTTIPGAGGPTGFFGGSTEIPGMESSVSNWVLVAAAGVGVWALMGRKRR